MSESPRRGSLRVAVMNVQAGAGTTRGWWQYYAARGRDAGARAAHIRGIGRGLKRAGVDLAMLLEIDGGSARTGEVDQAALLAAESGLDRFHFFPCFRDEPRVNQGNAVHAVDPVTEPRNHRLSGAGEPRFLSEAQVRRFGTTIRVFATHVSLKTGVRRGQLEQIAETLDGLAGPLLLGGDFNTRRSRELERLSSLLDHVPNGATFPSWRPRWALDHLFVSRHFSVRRARVLRDLRESDHLPAIFDLSYATTGERATPLPAPRS